MRAKGIIIAGTGSGSGKTTVTLGIMAALLEIGLKVQPFKCGPDFIDPTLHRLVTGRESINLDPWMSGIDFTRQTFVRHAAWADIAVIEGVMGMFDGGDSSSAALAALLGLPVVLVLDVSSAAESAAAVVKGFESLLPEVGPRGVILNKVAGERHLELVSGAIKKYCRAEISGYLPRTLNFHIPERHLGLHMGDEAPLSPEAVKELGRTVQQRVDLKRLVSPAAAPDIKLTLVPEPAAPRIRLGVARDRAFCFYYQDNLDLFRAAGAEIVFFSPLDDELLPENIDALYLGGGYPELYAESLAANKKMRQQIRKWVESDGPVYAECGGLMYLTERIATGDGQTHPMCGIFPVQARMGRQRASLGYRQIRLLDNCLLGRAGDILRGHEFHYSAINEMPQEIKRLYAVNNDTREGYSYRNVLGSYIHLHLGFSPRAAACFVENICP